MSKSFTLPTGYFTANGRDEFGQPCLDLFREGGAFLGGFDCPAEAIYAAQDDADALADEASEAAAAVADAAYEATLDTFRALVANAPVHVAPGDHAARGELRARNHLLRLIDGMAVSPTGVPPRAALSRSAA